MSSQYQFVNVNAFVPNSTSGWSAVSNITKASQSGNSFTLTDASGKQVIITILSPTAFRVRFNATSPNYSKEASYAVVNRTLGDVTATLATDTHSYTISTGVMDVSIRRQPFMLSVYRGSGPNRQLIHTDVDPSAHGGPKGLLYSEGQAVASIKEMAPGAFYFGLGEKAGQHTNKEGYSYTFFNYDNFTYETGPLPQGQGGGPLNPTEPVYCSIPFLIATNPNPQGSYSGRPYSYGLFLDNPSQSYFNLGSNTPTIYPSFPMDGLYYFGALYGDLDYYFMLGDDVPSVINQYTTLTGRPPLPPKYALGYHQGGYGYFDKDHVMKVANAYRDANIPCDGLHIDVDFQDNYRTFTVSNQKFPNARQMFADLANIGFKCSTNITAIITCNPQDENGNTGTPYPARDTGIANDVFIYNSRAGEGESDERFVGLESYGDNDGSNPYNAYPPLSQAKPGGPPVPLQSAAYYPNLGSPEVAKWWGKQYDYLFGLGLQMVWQDMTCPAIADDVTPPDGDQLDYNHLKSANDDFEKTMPLDLMLIGPDGETYQPNAEIHNGYALTLSRATYEGINQLRPSQRNFIIARGGYAGIQRYAALWTGDSASTWDFLRINIPEVLNLGLSGVPMSGCDIGGFANSTDGSESPQGGVNNQGQVVGGVTDAELLVRWMNLGAFLPWYRNHYDGYTKQYQEPYRYPGDVAAQCRKQIEIRYQMMQIFYDAMYQATQTGLPICRALFLNFPNDLNLYQHPLQQYQDPYEPWVDTEFFVGDNVLVAPIVIKGNPYRSIYLPQGSDWYAFQNNTAPLPAAVKGGTCIGQTTMTTPYYAPPGEVPIYIRAGAILPMRQIEQYVGQLPQNPLTINAYPGPDRSYTLYLDDGISTDATASKKAYRLTTISQTTSGNTRSVRVQRTYDGYTPPETFYYVGVLATTSPTGVTAGGSPLPRVTGSSDGDAANKLAASKVNAFYYNESLRTTFVKIFDTSADITVKASF
ncbi:TIM-barrel domain-containing protein [Sorangium sp. So ce341]|uniref:TIM-barrel domain-containing protein n=1 Tax=Sorangium sp. So ce341 TaxID=3133302 RepID=UPI003F611B9F